MYREKNLLDKFIAYKRKGDVIFYRTIIRCVKRNQVEDVEWFMSSPLFVLGALRNIRVRTKGRKLSLEMKIVLDNAQARLQRSRYISDCLTDDDD